MKVGIMQPYFVPYLGYWQLMNLVDKYVIFDDVNYINRGWINRNRILVNGNVQYFNIPLLGASQNKLIYEIAVNHDEKIINKNLRMLQVSYGNAPYFDSVYPLIKEILICKKENIAEYIEQSFYIIGDYLDIRTQFMKSSTLKNDKTLKGQQKILDICELLDATEYYNAIGGQELYYFSDFQDREIKLIFLQMNSIKYRQFDSKFYPNLSIIDVMMFNSKKQVQQLLKEYSLVEM